ncbi:hypothetical protein [Roseomonas indoligenes]|uniref:Uncharacterized protein n=1 Tax=Roseomonas indoligenes TaxID=2820811 RepID=A0A940S426_9PROT|nr:hypothetical protein [Pararoseomonas indoligenes]MBP0492851.1 hypothetical protein [Pararoseomonas indoligenes]
MRLTCSTTARDEFLKANWSNPELTLGDLADRMNAMVGPPIAGGTTVNSMRKRLGLPACRRLAPSAPRPSQIRAEVAAAPGPSLHGVKGVQGTSLATPDGGAYLPADNGDRTKAEELFAEGMFTRAVAATLQVDVGLVSCWYFAWKKRQPAPAASLMDGGALPGAAPASGSIAA